MKIYTANREYEYEGIEIIGIFTDREAADECCKNDFGDAGFLIGDSYDVEEHELQGLDGNSGDKLNG